MRMRLDGKVVVITGTAGGQGRAAALRFVAEGARVLGCDRNVEGAEETIAQAREIGGEMSSLHPCDLSIPEDVDRLVEFARSECGGVDVLYNNAGNPRFGWIPELSWEMWRETLASELDSVFLCSTRFWPMLVERGGGAIISTASVSAHRASEANGGLAHMAAKGAVVALTRQLAMEGAPHGIRANTISPGPVISPSTLNTKGQLDNEDWTSKMLSRIMLKRFGVPEDVASLALFLASDEAAWITGADFAVDGGMMAWA